LRSAGGARSTGDKVEPATCAANIESCDDCWVTVYLDRQHGAFHRANPELENMRDLCDFRESMN
jgi:hypothetical protein